MASIKEIIANPKDGRRAGSNNSWRIERIGVDTWELWHYSTLMLRWCNLDPNRNEVLHASIGIGSVSDQGALNTAFKVLNVDLRFDRDRKGGGPRIVDWRTGEVM